MSPVRLAMRAALDAERFMRSRSVEGMQPEELRLPGRSDSPAIRCAERAISSVAEIPERSGSQDARLEKIVRKRAVVEECLQASATIVTGSRRGDHAARARGCCRARMPPSKGAVLRCEVAAADDRACRGASQEESEKAADDFRWACGAGGK